MGKPGKVYNLVTDYVDGEVDIVINVELAQAYTTGLSNDDTSLGLLPYTPEGTWVKAVGIVVSKQPSNQGEMLRTYGKHYTSFLVDLLLIRASLLTALHPLHRSTILISRHPLIQTSGSSNAFREMIHASDMALSPS